MSYSASLVRSGLALNILHQLLLTRPQRVTTQYLLLSTLDILHLLQISSTTAAPSGLTELPTFLSPSGIAWRNYYTTSRSATTKGKPFPFRKKIISYQASTKSFFKTQSSRPDALQISCSQKLCNLSICL